MDRFHVSEFYAALQALSIGDSPVVVHSSLFQIGLPSDCNLDLFPKMVFDALREVSGPQATLCFPAANWDYGKKRVPFDLKNSPVDKALGVLSDYVVKLPDSLRSKNPIFSLAAVGPKAPFICSTSTATAFGHDSAWDRLFQLNGSMLFLGCDLTYLTFARFMEFRFGVPYLYNKLFPIPVICEGKEVSQYSSAPLRFHHCPVTYDLSRLQNALQERGYLKEVQVGKCGRLRLLKMSDCFEVGMSMLKEDLHAFLASPPEYKTDQIPLL